MFLKNLLPYYSSIFVKNYLIFHFGLRGILGGKSFKNSSRPEEKNFLLRKLCVNNKNTEFKNSVKRSSQIL